MTEQLPPTAEQVANLDEALDCGTKACFVDWEALLSGAQVDYDRGRTVVLTPERVDEMAGYEDFFYDPEEGTPNV